MKRMIIVCWVALTLLGCEPQGEKPVAAGSVEPMIQMQVLINDALLLAVHGADQQLAGQTMESKQLLETSASMLRQAMSGPAMAAMHQGGHAMSPLMMRTHVLGDAAFELLDGMMSLTPANKAGEKAQLGQMHKALAMAVSGRRMLLQQEPEGQVLLDQAAAMFPPADRQAGAYPQQLGRLLDLIVRAADKNQEK